MIRFSVPPSGGSSLTATPEQANTNTICPACHSSTPVPTRSTEGPPDALAGTDSGEGKRRQQPPPGLTPKPLASLLGPTLLPDPHPAAWGTGKRHPSTNSPSTCCPRSVRAKRPRSANPWRRCAPGRAKFNPDGDFWGGLLFVIFATPIGYFPSWPIAGPERGILSGSVMGVYYLCHRLLRGQEWRRFGVLRSGAARQQNGYGCVLEGQCSRFGARLPFFFPWESFPPFLVPGFANR